MVSMDDDIGDFQNQAERRSEKSRRNNFHIHLPSTPSIATVLTHGGASISGARSVPVSSADSPTDENELKSDYLSIRNSQHDRHQYLREHIRRDIFLEKNIGLHSYKIGKRRTNVIYSYDEIFKYRKRVQTTIHQSAVHPSVTRVFWPTDCEPQSLEPSVLVGFRNSRSDYVVIAIVPEVDISRMIETLDGRETLEHLSGFASIHGAYDSSKLCVLGTLNFKIKHSLPLVVEMNSRAEKPRFRMQEASTAIQRLNGHAILNGEYGLKFGAMPFLVIFYERPLPRRLQYISFMPINLELADRSNFNTDDEDGKNLRSRRILVDQTRKHTVFGFPQMDKEDCINSWINEINLSHELGSLLEKAVTLTNVLPAESHSLKVRIVVGTKLLISRTRNLLSFLWSLLVMAIMWILMGGLMLYRVASEAVLRIIEWQPKSSIPALKDVSATIQQLDLRLQQACYWPIQYITLRNQKSNLFLKTTFHPEYIRFYNSLWLVANDIIIGAAVGSYIIDNRDYIVAFVDYCINEILTTGLRRTIEWLMDWPGGLKLNNELAAFFGELFLWVIEFWGGYLRIFRPYLPDLVYLIGLSGFIGATFPIALIADLISFLTIQIYCCYLASARICNWQLTVLVSLFHLFRGKRRNVLRNRIDSCDYDLDQLLIGTLLFTLLTFLLPTVLVFYLTFACARLGIILINAMLESSLALLNHFPLFAIMLRLKDSKRLPGGIEFDLVEQSARDDGSVGTVYVQLKPIALPVTAMFQQYFLLSKRIQRHYLSLRVIALLLTGQFVPIQRSRLYSLQYSMLPENRFGIWELWFRLHEFSVTVREEVKKKFALIISK
ncbi:N-acetylglucosaminyl transferase component-domain-containing protein [Lipomyces kononenkoae]|uniref:N-acetylglucosaminyl transferase component-domain-containing protein n=1 Tax=Lipomyces kononenkoae TaxID=34357 RepID=A0ACC3T751_LIPKO